MARRARGASGRLCDGPAFTGRPCDHAGTGRHGGHPARTRRRGRRGGPPRPDRHPPAAEPARRVRRPCAARGGRGEVDRRPVLHLARRRSRLPAVRGAVAGGRARRARAPAARRQQHRRARPDASPRSTRIRTSRCGCTTRSSSAARARSASSPTSRASTAACTTSRSPSTTRSTVVGGRNIGDEYFGAGSGVVFADLDVLAVGPAVRDVSKQFDLYWNSASAYPAAAFVAPRRDRRRRALTAQFAATRADPDVGRLPRGGARHAARARPARAAGSPSNGRQPGSCTTTRPRRWTREGRTDVLLFPELVRTLGRPEKSLDLSRRTSCPATTGTAALAALARRGVKVRILTNSLAASDVSAVHAGLREAPPGPAARRRPALRAQADGRRRSRATARRASGRARRRACTPRPSPSTASASSSARSTSTRARRG